MVKAKKIDLPKTAAEILANVAGYSVFVITIAFMIFGWDKLPEEIPAHFNAAGEVDRYGSAIELLILPVIGLLVGAGMEVLERFPEIHNYPARLDDSNREAFYLNSRLILNLSKNMIFIIFSIIILEMMSVAINKTALFGEWLLPVILILVLGPVVFGMIQRRKIK
ncbi:DUF1648 domain-containing protein [Salinicoccus sp. HZC-1]|uniref:DUF1648 domain-containing protein n=1 Tax=Salinicoccus sp. HZC-1 TaxID=3385497 RepID=UPI00398B6AFA